MMLKLSPPPRDKVHSRHATGQRNPLNVFAGQNDVVHVLVEPEAKCQLLKGAEQSSLLHFLIEIISKVQTLKAASQNKY